MKELIEIQSELHCSKERSDAKGRFKYRNAEDIIEAVKPLYVSRNCYLITPQTVVFKEGRWYCITTAILTHMDGRSVSATAEAQEPLPSAMMNEPQCSGSAASYSKKYALANLFGIDNSDLDPDAQDPDANAPKSETKNATAKKQQATATKKTSAEEAYMRQVLEKTPAGNARNQTTSWMLGKTDKQSLDQFTEADWKNVKLAYDEWLASQQKPQQK